MPVGFDVMQECVRAAARQVIVSIHRGFSFCVFPFVAAAAATAASGAGAPAFRKGYGLLYSDLKLYI